MKIEQAANIFYIHYTKTSTKFTDSNIFLKHYDFFDLYNIPPKFYHSLSFYGTLLTTDLIYKQSSLPGAYWSDFRINE